MTERSRFEAIAMMQLDQQGEALAVQVIENCRDRTDHGALAALVQRTAVFARTSPEHKLRLVRALQSGGEIAAMTGARTVQARR